MIINYIRKHIIKATDANGIDRIKQVGAVRGVICAELEGDNVKVGYSLLNVDDMTKQQLKHGFTKAEKKDAIVRAMEREQFDVSDLSNRHAIIQVLLPDFLKRCGACFTTAKTINGVDITPYRRSYTERIEACKNITANLRSVAKGMEKLAEMMEINSLDNSKEAGIRISHNGAVIGCLDRLCNKTFHDDVSKLVESLSMSERDRLLKELKSNLFDDMKLFFGDLV